MAMAPGEHTISQPVRSISALMATRMKTEIGACCSSFSAPLWRSPDTMRIVTNGSRKTATISYALNVGAQTPTNGENASPTPIDVPPSPLASAYVRTALMNDTPTSGPLRRSMIHQDFETASSRHSLRSSHCHGRSSERKEHVLKVRRWLSCAVLCEPGELL